MTEDRNKGDHPKISDYSYLDDAPVLGWLWEVTRRSPSYREAWRSHKSTVQETLNAVEKDHISAVESKAAEEFGLLFFC